MRDGRADANQRDAGRGQRLANDPECIGERRKKHGRGSLLIIMPNRDR